jgi:glycosyltransferase involved in cell wall biosynthesis
VSQDLKVLLAHPGTQYARWLAEELSRRRALSMFVTGLALGEDSIAARVLQLASSSLKARLSSRLVRRELSKHLVTFPTTELWALFRLWYGQELETVLHARNKRFQQLIRDEWIYGATHVIGFDTSSWILAERSRAIGIPFVLDRSIGHSRAKEKVYENLRGRFPEWANTIQRKDESHLEREDIEHRTAKRIVVPSAFVRDTLVEHGVAAERISVVSFGADLDLFRPNSIATPAPPVIFLYAGTLTARKGVPVLLEAWKQAKLGSNAELWLAGSGELPESASRVEGVRYLGKVPREELATLMGRAHVFVFPSFFEGLAQVQVEALVSGLPVIGTHSSGATDLVAEGETGFIVPEGSIDHLADCLTRLTCDSSLLHRLRDRCVQTRESRSWHLYGDKWFSLLKELNES